MTAHRPTGHDVAARAGVSQSTVSLVLSGKASGRVSTAVVDRVTDAANTLRYQPDIGGRRLRLGRTQTVGLLVPDVTNPFLGRVLRGAQATARDRGYDVALVEPGDDKSEQLRAMRRLRAGAVDGLLLFVVEAPSTRELDELRPIVLIEAERRGVPSVALEIANGVEQAMEHLAGLGHRRIAHLAADIPIATFTARGRQWRAALDGLGVPPDDRYEAGAPFELHGARAAARELLQRRPRPTAMFCDDDLLAAAARLAASDLGITVPDQLSIVGFAGTVLSELTVPQLTTVAAPAEELGAVAMDKLLASIENGPVTIRTRLPMTLEVRESTTHPPATNS